MMTTDERVAWFVGAILLAAILFSGSAHAGQIGRGTLEFRGSGDFGHERLRVDGNFVGSTTEADVDLSLAIGVADILMLGGSVLFDYASLDPEGGGSISASSFRFAGDVIINVPTEKSIVPFVQTSVGLIHWSVTGNANPDISLVLPFVGGGFRVMMGENASFNVAAGFEYHTHALGSACPCSRRGSSRQWFPGSGEISCRRRGVVDALRFF